MNQLAFTLAGTAALTAGIASGQDIASNIGSVDAKNIRYAGVYNAVTHHLTPASSARGMSLGDPIYVNDSRPGTFYNVAGGDGGVIIDEGRVPGPDSPDVVGTQDSYTLTSLQIGYVTNATDPSMGGTGIDLQLKLYENFAPCGVFETTDAPIATIDLVDLPGSTSGGFAGVLLDVDLAGMGVCLRADGDDGYSNGTSDLFGWSIEYIDNGDGTGGGPFIASQPAVDAPGNGTVFTTPGTGSGLDTQDLWREYDPDGSVHCFFFGGYDPVMGTPFGSFNLIVRSDLSGDCIGCGIGDDRFEPNDDAASAAPVEFDTYGGLIADLADDFYLITVPPSSGLFVDLLFVDDVSDLDLILIDAASGTNIDTSLTATDDELAVAGNCDPVNPLDVLIRVDNFGGVCNEYDMIVTLDPLFADDSLEDNDTCANAVAGPLGTTRDLIVRPYCNADTGGDDGDYFLYTIPDGETITVDVLFDNDVADIDGVIYDLTSGCPGTTVETGFSVTDNEHMQYTNTSGGPLDVAVRVDWFSGKSSLYDLIVKIGPETIGELICLGEPNSASDGARVCITGSDVAADNDVTYDVTGLPTDSMGYFFVSQDRFFVANPNGSMGNICIASFTIGRFTGDVLDSGATGEVSFSPDLTMVPFASAGGSGTVAVMAGDTFNAQYWYRDMDDMMMPTSNMSDAVGIVFN